MSLRGVAGKSVGRRAGRERRIVMSTMAVKSAGPNVREGC